MIHCRRRATVQTEAHAILPARSRRWVLWAVLAMTLAAVPAHAQPYVYALGYEPTPDSAFARLVAINAATNAIVGSVALGENPAPAERTSGHLARRKPHRCRQQLRSDRLGRLRTTLAILDTYTQALLGIRPGAVTVSSDSSRVYVSGTAPVMARTRRSSASSTSPRGREWARFSSARRRRPGLPPRRMVRGSTCSPSTHRRSRSWTRPPTASSTRCRCGLMNFGTTVALSPDGRYASFPRSSTMFSTPGDGGARHHDRDDCRESDNRIRAATRWRLAERRGRLCAGSRSRRIDRLNPSTHAAEGATPLTKAAYSIAFLPNSSRAYVAAGVDIFVVDAATHAVVRTISMFPVGLNFGVSAIVATPPPFVPPGLTPTGLHAPSIRGEPRHAGLDRSHQRVADQLCCRGGREPGPGPGQSPTGSPATTFSFDAPTGVYYVRVHALSASGRSFASNEIRIAVNMPQVPSSPADLLGLTIGSNLLLSWKTTHAGGPPASHVLDVSGAATLSVPIPAGETFCVRRCSWGNLHVHGARGEYHRRQRSIGAADAHLPPVQMDRAYDAIDVMRGIADAKASASRRSRAPGLRRQCRWRHAGARRHRQRTASSWMVLNCCRTTTRSCSARRGPRCSRSATAGIPPTSWRSRSSPARARCCCQTPPMRDT